MEILVFLVAIIVIAIGAFIASEFGNIAEDKGYDRIKYFWCTFLFGIAGMLMVIALPKKEVSDSPKKIAEELPEL